MITTFSVCISIIGQNISLEAKSQEIMDHVLHSSAIDRGFEPGSSKTKDYEILNTQL